MDMICWIPVPRTVTVLIPEDTFELPWWALHQRHTQKKSEPQLYQGEDV